MKNFICHNFNMVFNPEIHHRRSIRLKEYDYSQEGYYFLTLCVKDRKCLLGEIQDGKMILNQYGEIVEKCWYDLPNHYINCKLDIFVIMPNHFHGVIRIDKMALEAYVGAHVGAIHELPAQRRSMIISKIMGRFKMQSAKSINIILGASGQPFWQRNYYERIIRNENELGRIREYIESNPLKWERDRNNQ